MKGDFTRFTFKKENHYRDVRMQQGRVQLDADWNEQLDITGYRVETGSVDLVGHCGAPMHHAGFHVVTQVSELTPEEENLAENQNPAALESNGDVFISGGHYYVDGILCENEEIIAFTKQSDLPEAVPVSQKGTYLAYLDVWLRHLTVLEAQQIREVALGGPDTTTRTKTLWQVKLLRVGDAGMQADCLKDLNAWKAAIKPGTGKMAAQTEKDAQSTDPCILSPDAGYRRLENQLYRVEVHNGGPRGTATFKWSRDNGSIVSRWEEQDVNKLTVSSSGRDQKSSLASGQWIELTDDTRELLRKPGILAQIEKMEGQTLTIDPNTIIDPDNPAATSVDKAEFSNNPKIRRWDSDSLIKPTNLDWKDLEDGVQVQFSSGDYKTGDYWLIPARTATRADQAGVEWPLNPNTNKPQLQLSHGIKHHYCKLGLLVFDGNNWVDVQDCRNIFPPVTELTSLLYVSGDGQAAMPGNQLDWPLQVRVVNGQHPVTGAKVKFTVESGAGNLSVSGPVESTSEGVAICQWILGQSGKQQVKAELLDAAGDPLPGQVIHFNADLSIAGEVAYVVPDCDAQYGDSDPTVHSLLAASANWPDIDQDGQSTVKDILDALLCKLDASKIPFEVTECSNSIFEAKRQTVAEALLSLCNMERLAGCAITIGSKEQSGKYASIQEALEKEKGDDICLCLLPGEHTIDKDPNEKGRNSIKITGCGAKIYVKGTRVALAANSLMLYGAKFYMADEKASMVLAGENISAERCEFSMKIKNSDSAPLVTITPLDDSQAPVNLRWEANKMEAWWIETIPQKVSDFLMPVVNVEYSAAARDRLVKLSKLNPHEETKEFEIAVKKIANDIEKLPVASRNEWFERRPRTGISKLPKQQQAVINSLFDVIKSERLTPQLKLELRQNLVDAFKAFYIFYYADAVALAKGVGGWLADNVIKGYVSLHYSDTKSSYLGWITGQSDQEIARINSNKAKWVREVMKGRDYVLMQNVSLNLRGNDFYAVRSNAPSIMKVIGNILKSGEGVLEDLDLAYESLTATDNTFHSNSNSFVSKALNIQGNKFLGGTQDYSVVANVVGYIGTFTGNLASQPNMQAIVDCILRIDPPEAANFLRIENFS